MDNAGGHGTSDAKNQYTEILKEMNIEIVWQVPRSPETNLLDLGVWCTLQSAVEKLHRRRVKSSVDALATTVSEAWGEMDVDKLERIYLRWELVLQLIIADNGDNKAIDKHRGQLLIPLVLPCMIDLTGEDTDEEAGGEEPTSVESDDEVDDLDLIGEQSAWC